MVNLFFVLQHIGCWLMLQDHNLYNKIRLHLLRTLIHLRIRGSNGSMTLRMIEDTLDVVRLVFLLVFLTTIRSCPLLYYLSLLEPPFNILFFLIIRDYIYLIMCMLMVLFSLTQRLVGFVLL